MSTNAQVKTIFSYCDSDGVADILSGAAYVTCFLREVAVAYSGDDMRVSAGLSDNGSTGLHMILCGIENSINLAIERL